MFFSVAGRCRGPRVTHPPNIWYVSIKYLFVPLLCWFNESYNSMSWMYHKRKKFNRWKLTSSQKLGRYTSRQVRSVWKSFGRVRFGLKKFRAQNIFINFPTELDHSKNCVLLAPPRRCSNSQVVQGSSPVLSRPVTPCPKWSELVHVGLKWSKMVWNCTRRFEIVQDGVKWFRMV